MAAPIIPKLGFFCKNCGAFFPFLKAQLTDRVVDEEGWGIAISFICPLCHHEAEYLSSDVTMESEEDRKRFIPRPPFPR